MPFRLKNTPSIFSKVVVTTFKEFIHNIFYVYFDDWKVLGLVKNDVSSLPLMLDTCQNYQISLNLKKFILCVPYGILLGHVVCKHGLMVDPTKTIFFFNMDPPRNAKQLCVTQGHIRYYRNFIKAYAKITVPMEILLKKDATFYWDDDFHKSLDFLKEEMVTAAILVFPD